MLYSLFLHGQVEDYKIKNCITAKYLKVLVIHTQDITCPFALWLDAVYAPS
jgi:hypothetical protein